MILPPALATRLEKAAVDNGFDQELPCQEDWLGFSSTHAPLQIWLTAIEHGPVLIALSQTNVAKALADQSGEVKTGLPDGACAALAVQDVAALHRILRLAFQLSRSLPDELLLAFQAQTVEMPRSTEIERLVIQRVGQDLFRQGLLEYWDGRCAVTGLAVPELLRASHIKPWADCDSNAERLDIFNGLLLAPHLDAAFDQGFITFGDDGAVLVSCALAQEDRRVLSIGTGQRASGLVDGHRRYLTWHRSRVFRSV